LNVKKPVFKNVPVYCCFTQEYQTCGIIFLSFNNQNDFRYITLPIVYLGFRTKCIIVYIIISILANKIIVLIVYQYEAIYTIYFSLSLHVHNNHEKKINVLTAHSSYVRIYVYLSSYR
jgi:hypothetical protein